MVNQSVFVLCVDPCLGQRVVCDMYKWHKPKRLRILLVMYIFFFYYHVEPGQTTARTGAAEGPWRDEG